MSVEALLFAFRFPLWLRFQLHAGLVAVGEHNARGREGALSASIVGILPSWPDSVLVIVLR
jgi:hypothetical protein